MATQDPHSSISISRRHAIVTTARVLGFAGLARIVGVSTVAEAQEKMSQEVAKYQDHPSDEKNCAQCSHFMPPDGCHLVAGKISPNGWCKYFAVKVTPK